LLAQLSNLFSSELERRHFTEYLPGLYIARHNIVSGINREFTVTRPNLSESVAHRDPLERAGAQLVPAIPPATGSDNPVYQTWSN
jgi:hypothetical protein